MMMLIATKAKLGYKDVCLHAVKTFNELTASNMWEPSKLPKDRQAPVVNITAAEILTLIESVNSTNGQVKAPHDPTKAATTADPQIIK